MTPWIAFLCMALLAAWLGWRLKRAEGCMVAAEAAGRAHEEILRAETSASIASQAEAARAVEAAQAANEAKTRYLVAASHEIRSPLNTIYGYAQLLERDDGIRCDEAGASIRRSAEHLTNLVEGLLDISRIEGGVLKLRSEVVDVRDMLAHVAEMFRIQAAAKGLTLDLTGADRLPDRVKTDGKRLRQILINIVSNAVKYTDAGSIRVDVAYRSQVAEIVVSDTGVGIPPEELESIFEPFERGRAAAQGQPGIGLGLAITRVLVRVLGGDIDVASTPGAGSRFRLRLLLPPLWAPPVATPAGGRITGYAGPRRMVLLVDDDPAQLEMLRAFLVGLGFAVHTAASGPAALARAAEQLPDIVLLDIQLPGLTGWQVAQELRANHGASPKIVMVSANAHEFSAGGQDGSDHDAFVTKPVDFDALTAVLGTQLALDWTRADPVAPPLRVEAPSRLPPAAAGLLDAVRDQARIGHVDGVAQALDHLEREVPVSLPLVAALRHHLNDFDLRSLLKTLDDAER